MVALHKIKAEPYIFRMMQNTDMTEAQLFALQDAVTLARSGEIYRLEVLKAQLISAGHTEDDIDAALSFWSQELNKRYPGGRKKLEVQMQLEGYPA